MASSEGLQYFDANHDKRVNHTMDVQIGKDYILFLDRTCIYLKSAEIFLVDTAES